MFGKPFSTLLTSVVVALLAGYPAVEAAPVQPAGIVTLPLQRYQMRSDVHPQILLQQHVNRAHQRLARMTGSAPPTSEELVDNLHKRMYLTPNGPGSHKQKRYNAFKPSAPVTPNAQQLHAGHSAKTSTAKVSEDTDAEVEPEAEPEEVEPEAEGVEPEAEEGEAEVAAASGTNLGITPIEFEALTQGGTFAADEPSTANSLGLDIIANDVGYFATIQVGTPPRDFKILMDSGSADLWIGGENCKSQSAGGGGCGDHNFLGEKSSSSFVDSGEPFSITYGTGQVSGTKVADDIRMAGLELPGHKFGVTTVESVEFTDASSPFDGLMGLAKSTLSNQGVLTPPEAMAQAGLIKEAIVSYKISRLADEKNDGEITFGGLDTSKFDPKTLVTLPNLSANGFWAAKMDAVTVNGQPVQARVLNAILDTGTTLIIAPQADANAIHAAIPGAESDGQGGFTIPCTTNAKVALVFGGTSFEIDGRDLAFVPLSNDPKGLCVSGISGGDFGGGGAWLVGDVFLKNAYFSHNASRNQLSLAKLV